jgi:hypothetical protein
MIEREDKEWGIRLIARPFHGIGKNTNMQIQAEISNPTPKRNPQITIVFSAAPPQMPLPLSDAQTWRQTFDALLDEAKSIAEDLKAKRKKSTKRKKVAKSVRRTKRSR